MKTTNTLIAITAAFALHATTTLAQSGALDLTFMHRVGPDINTQCQGNCLSVTATQEGARLRCVFQRLEGEVMSKGLWLESTERGSADKFRLSAAAVGRDESSTLHSPLSTLSPSGKVAVGGQSARYIRPGLTEEYSVSVDGVRQDFVIAERPAGAGDLRVELALNGARAEAAAYGAQLTLEGSGRALAYSRLRVADATGQELTARLEVLSADRLAVRVADANATYPVRIDPTFSDADWVSLNPGLPGANGEVYALAVDDSGNVYVGGVFSFIGTVPATNIAKWNGSTWSALGAGINGSVFVLALSGTDLYAGGQFSRAGGVTAYNIAKWDGTAWSALGAGVNNWVSALAVSGTNFYAGGAFNLAGGGSANHIAKWDGSAWSRLGSGLIGDVAALAVSGTNLYAGGAFTRAGGVPAKNIAKWDGSAWSALDSGMDGPVSALAVSGTDLYAGGEFTTAGGVSATNIAKWDGSAWSALGEGMEGDNAVVYTLAVSGTNLYAGGQFSKAGGVTAINIAKWDGSAWSALGEGIGDWMNPDDWVSALAVNGSNLYAAGGFHLAGTASANNIAKYDGNAWSALSAGMNNSVYALAVSGTNLYAGGEFTSAGGVTPNYVAKWNGSAWSALGSGMGGYYVSALVVSGTGLFAGGSFTTAGGAPATNIAKWDGTTWSALGEGTSSEGTGGNDAGVWALAVNGTNLYAGGSFTTMGGVPATNIAKWDGHAWSALGEGMGGGVQPFVRALAVSGADLYAAGYFTTAGGVAASSIAKWNGSAWSALGQGINGHIYALAVSGTNLYAGGSFTTAGGVPATNIAKWDGAAWSALGSGFGDQYSEVDALAVNGDDLYAGGGFLTAGGVPARDIAKWDGSAWSALGSGMDGGVSALATDEAGHLLVGGYFYLAGTTLSPFVAQANVGAGVHGGRFDSLVYSPVTGFSCTFRDASVGQPYRIQTSPSLAAGSWTDFTNVTYTGPIIITDASTGATTKRFYRAVTP